MRSLRRPAAILLLAVAACGDRTRVAGSDLPWRTVIDSTADTIVARVSGDVPPALVSTLVPELEIGALDGPEELTFGSIGDVIGLADGGMLVHDDGRNAQIIRLYDAAGTFVKPLGGKGGGPGEYGQVNGIARHPSGSLFVWDATNGRVNRYGADGVYAGMFRSAFTGWFTNNSLFVDTRGRVAMWTPILTDPNDPMNRRDSYVRFTAEGELVDTVMHPVWPDEAVPLQAQSRDGRSRTMTTRPWSPNGVTTHYSGGGLVSGPGGAYEFFVLPDSGRPTRVVREYTPVPVSDTERDERREQIEQNMRRLDPGWNWTGAPIPASKPAYQRFLVGEDGRIWVQVFTPGEPIPAAELEAMRAPVASTAGAGGQSAPRRIQLTTREPLVYDVFEPTGRLLGRVALPPRTRVIRARGNLAWGTRSDADGVEFAVRFRIEPALERRFSPE
jgi:hypothetical protein